MSDTAAAPATGRFIRAALVIFPAGTIILGILSFGIWWWKRERVEQRGYQYALALRRDLSESGLSRHAGILHEALSRADPLRFQAVAAYLESSMGAENMGYQVRRERAQVNGMEVSDVEVELTGRQRPREVVLLLVPYGFAARAPEESRALAMMMSLAHAITGEARARTLRLAALPLGADPGALLRLTAACDTRRERLVEVLLPGGEESGCMSALVNALQPARTGVIIKSLPAPADTGAALAAAAVLRQELLRSAE